MKVYLLILSLLTFSNYSIAQNDETLNIKENFNAMSKMGNNKNSGFQSLQTYSNGEIKGSQFFSPKWAKGSVTSKDGSTISNNYYFVYDKVRQELFIKEIGSSQVLLGEKNEIMGFTLNTDKVHSFVPAKTYDKENEKDFFEVLLKNDNGFTVLKKISTKFFPVDKRDIMKVKSGDFSDEFRDEIKYFVSFKKGKLEEFKLREKSILKVLPDTKEHLVKQYFKENNRDINDEYVVNLFTEINK